LLTVNDEKIVFKNATAGVFIELDTPITFDEKEARLIKLIKKKKKLMIKICTLCV